MTRYLLDTNAAGNYLYRRRGVYDRGRAESLLGNRLGIGTPVLAELAYGAERSASRERNMEVLERTIASRCWALWGFEDRAAWEFGRIAAELRRVGRTIQTVDIQIAAIAITLGNTIVVSADSDLLVVTGLVVENWES